MDTATSPSVQIENDVTVGRDEEKEEEEEEEDVKPPTAPITKQKLATVSLGFGAPYIVVCSFFLHGTQAME